MWRPGILVSINDADWELVGEGDYVLRDGDVCLYLVLYIEATQIKGLESHDSNYWLRVSS